MPGESGYVISLAVLVKPRGVPHAFWNPAGRFGRMLEIIAPAGFEGYFAGLGEIFTGQGFSEPGCRAELAERYGLDLDLVSVFWLAVMHGLFVPGAPLGMP